MIALLFAMIQAQPPVLTVPPVVFAGDAVAVPVPRLVWPDGADLRVEEDDGEIVVRYDRPLTADHIAAFRDAAGPAIGDLRWNDDNLVLRAASGWRMTWRRSGSTLSVTFVRLRTAQTPRDATDDATRDAEVAAIEADAAAGYPGQARLAAATLAARYPDDRRIARLAADTRLADGDVRGAARAYRALDADDRGARRAMAAAPGTASIGITARDGSDMAQVELGARIDAAIDDRFGAGGGVRHVVSKVAGAPRVSETVIDATLAAALTDTIRVQLLASTALDDRVTGGGAKLTAGSAETQVRATLLAHMPDFSTPAQMLAGGYLSRALVGVTYRLTPGVVLQADVGANRYGLAKQSGASDTLVANGGVDYLIRRQFPALGLTYRFEAEYVQRMRTGANGAAIVPLASRENHTLQGLISGSLGIVQLTGLAGWTVDRFGGDGPTASIGVAAPVGIGWRIEGSGGITSISRPGFVGQQVFARALLARSLGDGK
jgi:hypothetical protein